MTEHPQQQFFGQLPVYEGLVVLVEDFGQPPSSASGRAVSRRGGDLKPGGDVRALGLVLPAVAPAVPVHLDAIVLGIADHHLVAVISGYHSTSGSGQGDGLAATSGSVGSPRSSSGRGRRGRRLVVVMMVVASTPFSLLLRLPR